MTSDRLIQIYVGKEDQPENEKPFLIQQSILCNASDYFTKAIKNEHLGSGESGVLRFPTDDRETWKIFLYWFLQGSLPDELEAVADDEAVSKLIKCWIFGDKYFTVHFQDEVMLEMLRAGDIRPWRNLELVIEAFRGTLLDSHLFWMASEQLVSGIYARGRFEDSQLDAFDEIPGATRVILTTIRIAHEIHNEFDLEFGEFTSKLSRWDAFMVGKGPVAHWVHDVAIR